jgi:hypothetical protein
LAFWLIAIILKFIFRDVAVEQDPAIGNRERQSKKQIQPIQNIRAEHGMLTLIRVVAAAGRP